MRKNIEDARKTVVGSSVVPYPERNDVLLERRKCPGHFGSDVFHKMIAENRPRFHHVEERLEKTVMAIDIVQTIQKAFGGRFLVRLNDGWKVLDDEAAKERVYRALRRKYVAGGISETPRRCSSMMEQYPGPLTKKLRHSNHYEDF